MIDYVNYEIVEEHVNVHRDKYRKCGVIQLQVATVSKQISPHLHHIFVGPHNVDGEGVAGNCDYEGYSVRSCKANPPNIFVDGVNTS